MHLVVRAHVPAAPSFLGVAALGTPVPLVGLAKAALLNSDLEGLVNDSELAGDARVWGEVASYANTYQYLFYGKLGNYLIYRVGL